MVFTKLGREGLLEGLTLLRDLERELSRSIGDESMAQLRRALVGILATMRSGQA